MNMGGLGETGGLAANLIAKEADLVIGIGTRYTDFTTSSKWLYQNPDVNFININVSEFHGGDPFNSFDVTLQLIWDLVQLYGFIERKEWAEMVPRNLPVYLISGDHDPCGNYGEGLYHTANLLASTGHPVKVHAYPGYRHEIHNELDLRDEVEQGLVDFLDEVLEQKKA